MAARAFSRILAVTGLLAAAALFFLVPRLGRKQTIMPTDSDLAAITLSTGIAFPTGTRVLHIIRSAEGEQNLRAVVQLPTGALPTFLTANTLTASQFSPLNHGLLAGDDGAWDPSVRGPFPVYAREPREGAYLYLGYIDAAEGARMYVSWFRT
jgi:hypothetical protein